MQQIPAPPAQRGWQSVRGGRPCSCRAARGGCAGADQRQSRSPGNSRAGAHEPASHATGSGTRSGSRNGPGAKPAPPPETYEEPSFLGSLTEDPLLAGGALTLVLALLGYGGYRVAQSRRQQAQLDSSFQDSGNPDSFFGASGGQHVDTADSSLTTGASSMSYSPSQLDVGGDVDPVAEADVYRLAVTCRPKKSSRRPCATTRSASPYPSSWPRFMPSARIARRWSRPPAMSSG